MCENPQPPGPVSVNARSGIFGRPTVAWQPYDIFLVNSFPFSKGQVPNSSLLSPSTTPRPLILAEILASYFTESTGREHPPPIATVPLTVQGVTLQALVGTPPPERRICPCSRLCLQAHPLSCTASTSTCGHFYLLLSPLDPTSPSGYHPISLLPLILILLRSLFSLSPLPCLRSLFTSHQAFSPRTHGHQ